MYSETIHNPTPAVGIRDFCPRVYQPSGGWRAFLLFISVLFGGFSAAGVWYFGTMHEVRSVLQAMWMVGICLVFVLLSCYLVGLMFRARVILKPDSIESRELFRRRALLRDQILGYRIQQNPRAPASLVLVPRDSSRKKLKFTTYYNFDQTFWDWIEALPNLDQEDQRAAQREMLENAEIGTTPQDRLVAVENAKKLATFFTVAASAVCAWGWFYPEPYWLVMGLLMGVPWFAFAITMRSGGLFRIDSRRNDPHPTVAIPFLLPGCVLAVRAASDINLLEWRAVLYLAILLGFALGAMAIIAYRSLRAHKGAMLAFVLLTILYSYGASVGANVIFDRAGATIFRATVIRKHVVSGRHTGYQLSLSPWGPQQEPSEVSISRQWYESLEPGDTVCTALHQGALHNRWYTVQPCPEP